MAEKLDTLRGQHPNGAGLSLRSKSGPASTGRRRTRAAQGPEAQSVTRPVRIGLYPGTFDPITRGHIDIIARAAKLVDKLVIGVAENREKRPLFSPEERVEMVRAETRRFSGVVEIEVTPFNTLLMAFAMSIGASVIVRGLRAVSDFEYEFQMVAMNQKLNPQIETVFLMADPTHQAIASRLVKEIARLGGDVTPFVTAGVAARLQTKAKEGF
jgi:pantetheine-phosphate adenylyltransferase